MKSINTQNTRNIHLEYTFLGLIFLIFFLNTIAYIAYLYWRISWFDILMHFLGGAFVALFAFYLIYHSKYFISRKHSSLMIVTLSITSAFVVGFLWEVFEFFMDKVALASGSNVISQTSIGDTLSDLVADMFGGFFAGVFYLKKWVRK